MKIGWLLGSRSSLLRMRQELWLTRSQVATVDRGIAALDKLAAEVDFDDSSGEIFAHHQANRSPKE